MASRDNGENAQAFIAIAAFDDLTSDLRRLLGEAAHVLLNAVVFSGHRCATQTALGGKSV
jgi:hypothetical protein